MAESLNESLMDAVAILSDWRLVQTFRCEALLTDPSSGVIQRFDVHAEPNHLSYSVTETATGKQWTYDDATRTAEIDGHVMHQQPYHLLTEPLPVRLAFPVALPVWGRGHDTYRMIDAHEDGDEIIVGLRGRTDRALSGTLAIDVVRGLATRIDTPTLQLEYRGIERARPQYKGQIS